MMMDTMTGTIRKKLDTQKTQITWMVSKMDAKEENINAKHSRLRCFVSLRYILMACSFSLAIFFTSCNFESNSDIRSNLEEQSNLRNELKNLQIDILSKITELNSKINLIEDKIHEIEIDIIVNDFVKTDVFFEFTHQIRDEILEIQLALIDQKAVFNLKEKEGFSKINSGGHIFFISVENVQPYLEGFKVLFKIGNPQYVTYSDPKIKIKWNKDLLKYFKEKKSSDANYFDVFSAWEKSSKSKEISALKDLEPGVWNRFEILITPATLDEIEHVEFSMEVNKAAFYNDRRTL